MQNPQVTKNSLNAGTLEKVSLSTKKVPASTLVQPLGRNSHLGALINSHMVKSQNSLLESASRRDTKSKLFGGKKNQQLSLSKKQSNALQSEIITTSQPRPKRSTQQQQHAVLSGNQTMSSNWTQPTLEQHQSMMSKTTIGLHCLQPNQKTSM